MTPFNVVQPHPPARRLRHNHVYKEKLSGNTLTDIRTKLCRFLIGRFSFFLRGQPDRRTDRQTDRLIYGHKENTCVAQQLRCLAGKNNNNDSLYSTRRSTTYVRRSVYHIFLVLMMSKYSRRRFSNVHYYSHKKQSTQKR